MLPIKLKAKKAYSGDTYTGDTWNIYDIVSTQTSGAIVSGATYSILKYVTGDNFTNVGGVNKSETRFTASGTTPTTYTNGSTLLRIELKDFTDVVSVKAEFYHRGVKKLTMTDLSGIELISDGVFRIAKQLVTLNAMCLDFDVQFTYGNGDVLTLVKGTWPIENDLTQ